MKQGIIVLVLLVGTIFVVSANGYGRDETERQGRNVVANSEEAGIVRGYKNRDESMANSERQRQNVVAPEDCTLDEPGTGYLDENKRGYQNQPNPKGRARNRN